MEGADGAIEPPDAMLLALLLFATCASVSIGRYAVGRAVPAQDDSGAAVRLAESVEAEEASRSSAHWTVVADRYGLSPRERDVFELLVQGRSRTYIREALFISRGTVDTHIQHIYGKMGINSKEELMHIVYDGAR